MITLRPANFDDAIHLYVWRNHPTTRAQFFNNQHITWEAHLQWLRDVIEDPTQSVYIAMRESQAVGTLRFHIARGEAEVSVTVAPECRGGGLGTAMLLAGTAQALRTCQRVVAKIKTTNIASQRAFAKAGYRVINGTAEEVTMVAGK